MIAAARARNPDIEFREGDAEQLPLSDDSFDAAVMNFGILHLARPDQALVQACRVLRAGGRFAFTVWAKPEDAVGFQNRSRFDCEARRSERAVARRPAILSLQ